jgi:hypothetical protein
MLDEPKGPIEHASWGKFIICGQEHSEGGMGGVGAGKDIRVIGTDVTPWDERKGHRLKKKMITAVYEKDLDVLVIGTGINGAIECPEKVRKAVRENGIDELVVQPTIEACKAYNRLHHEGRRVALLAHGTC